MLSPQDPSLSYRRVSTVMKITDLTSADNEETKIRNFKMKKSN